MYTLYSENISKKEAFEFGSILPTQLLIVLNLSLLILEDEDSLPGESLI